MNGKVFFKKFRDALILTPRVRNCKGKIYVCRNCKENKRSVSLHSGNLATTGDCELNFEMIVVNEREK